jgi:hypothetical protein
MLLTTVDISGKVVLRQTVCLKKKPYLFIEIFEILSIPSRKKFNEKRFFSSGNLAIEILIGFLKIQELNL